MSAGDYSMRPHRLRHPEPQLYSPHHIIQYGDYYFSSMSPECFTLVPATWIRDILTQFIFKMHDNSSNIRKESDPPLTNDIVVRSANVFESPRIMRPPSVRLLFTLQLLSIALLFADHLSPNCRVWAALSPSPLEKYLSAHN